MTLSTKTPRDFFSKHQLVLHVAKSEMDKVRVFQDNGESPLAVPSLPPAKGTQPLHTLLGENSRAPPPCQVLRIKEAAGSELEGLFERGHRKGTDKTQATDRVWCRASAEKGPLSLPSTAEADRVCPALLSLTHMHKHMQKTHLQELFCSYF